MLNIPDDLTEIQAAQLFASPELGRILEARMREAGGERVRAMLAGGLTSDDAATLLDL